MAKAKSRQGEASKQQERGRQGERSPRAGGSSVARVTEITATSTVSFEDAIDTGIERATKTLRNVRSAWIKEQQVRVSGGSISEYQVNMLVTFVLED